MNTKATKVSRRGQTLRSAREPMPKIVVFFAVLALVYILGPIIALFLAAPWDHLSAAFTQSETWDLLRVTVGAGALSTVCSLVLGVPLALWAYTLRRGKWLIRLLVLIPLAMPPVVSGLALNAALGRRGLAAPVLERLGLEFSFSFSGVVIAHAFITLPFVVVTIDAALRQLNPEVLASAGSVGMRPSRILVSVLLPALRPAIATGGGLAFARSLGEFGTTLTFAGSLPGTTRTMSQGIYFAREVSLDAAYGLSLILIALALGCLLLTSLPFLFSSTPQPQVRKIHRLNAGRLDELTRPREKNSQVLSIQQSGRHATAVQFPRVGIITIVGPNGSGKSTLAGWLSGRLHGAEVSFGPESYSASSPRTHKPAFKRDITMVNQSFGLPPHTTAAGALTMITKDPKETAELLDAAGLEELAEVAVRALSGGQAAQIAMLRAFATKRSVVVLDESLAALDYASAALWRDFLLRASSHRCIVLISHELTDVTALASEVVVMDEGKVAGCGSAQELLVAPPTTFFAELSGHCRLKGRYRTAVDGGLGELSIGKHTALARLSANEALVPSLGDDVALNFNCHDAWLEPASTYSAAAADQSVNRWVCQVVSVAAISARNIHVRLKFGTQEILVVTSPGHLVNELQPGSEVVCCVRANDSTAYLANLEASTLPG